MTRLLQALAVVLVALLASGPALRGGFVYDDEYYLLQNEAVTGSGALWSAPLGTPDQGLWRPLTVATWAVQWAGPDDAGALHAGSLALHVVVCLLLLLLGRRLGLPDSGALVAALLFAAHPVHAEAVAWVTGRSELLAAALVLLAWIGHLTRGPAALAGSALALGLAILAKENALAAPALFVVADLLLHRRPLPWRRWLVLAVVVGALFALRTAVLPSPVPADGPFVGATLPARLVVALDVLGRAVGLLAWPHPLRIEYQRSEFAAADPLALAAVAALGLAVWFLRRRHRRAALGLLLVPVALIPVLHLVPIGEPFAERFLYLPSVPFCLALGALFAAWGRRELARGHGLGPSLATLLVVLGVCTVASRQATASFHDDLTLWAHAAEVAPELPLVRYNHGDALHRAGHHLATDVDRPGCTDELRASLRLDPDHVFAGFAHQTLGLHALGAVGTDPPDPVAAARHFRAALERLPGLTAARLDLGSLAVSAPSVVSPAEARDLLIPLLLAPEVERPDRRAAEDLLAQLPEEPASGSSPEPPTGTSSDDGS